MRTPETTHRGRPELFALTALALATRFWALDSPLTVVFDETYYQQNAGHYLAGTFYFNLHPPIGSLLLGAWAWIAGPSAESLLRPEPAPLVRALPALAGALVIPAFHTLLLQLGAHRRVALLGATLLLFDNAVLAVSRLVLLDSMLLLFGLVSLTTLLASFRERNPRRWTHTLTSAGFAGLAVGTKWSGLAAIAVALVIVFWRAATQQMPRRETAALLVLFIALPAAMYVGSFALHFSLLPRWGLGATMMSPAFQETLAASPTFRADASMAFTARFIDAHRAMVKANDDIASSTHPGASPWWSWPILKHPMLVWEGDATPTGERGRVLITGNPVVWWGTLFILGALATAAAASSRARVRLAPWRLPLTLLLICYLISFLPFAFIPRHLFLYSYFPAFVFSLALAILGGGALLGNPRALGVRAIGPAQRKANIRAAAGALVALLVLTAFLYLAPLTYGTPISDSGFANRLRLIERSP